MVFGLAVGIFIWSLQKPVYYTSRLFEINYQHSDIPKYISLTDHAVTLVRSTQVLSELIDTKGLEIKVYKPSPLSVVMEVGSTDRDKIDAPLKTLSEFLKDKHQMKLIGRESFYIKNPKLYLYALIGTASGLMSGVVISLIKEYFHAY